MKVEITGVQKVILVWSILALIGAEYIRWNHFSQRIESRIGLIELLAAILTGLALGISLLARTKKDWDAPEAEPAKVSSAGR